MRNPNGYGGITKLPGNRRNPWRVQKTIGWEFVDRKTKKVIETIENSSDYYLRQKFISVGYFKTKEEAMIALAEYNKNPYNLDISKLTFADVYDKWSDNHFKKIKDISGYRAAYKACLPLHHLLFKDIKFYVLQELLDTCGKNAPTLKNIKILFSQLWDYAVLNDICSKETRDKISYLDISAGENPNSYQRSPFTKNEIEMLWNKKNHDEYISIILILIYSGLRISELLELKKDDIHIKEKWFHVQESKTCAGVRDVPIADKIMPFFEKWMTSDSAYLISKPNGKSFNYEYYYNKIWKIEMVEMGFGEFYQKENVKKESYKGHRPHDTRHTCASLLAQKEVDERIIKQIIGHKGKNITETVYTHIDMETKLDAINKI